MHFDHGLNPVFRCCRVPLKYLSADTYQRISGICDTEGPITKQRHPAISADIMYCKNPSFHLH